MDGLPVMLRVDGRRCVVVGAGGVARRRAAALHARGAEVVVIGPDADAGEDWPATAVHVRRYAAGDLAGAWLVVIATDDPAVNAAVAAEAAERGLLVNRADEPTSGDVTVLAHRQRGPVTVAVSTDGISARAAGEIAGELIDRLDADLPVLLEAARRWRARVQEAIVDPERRQRVLRALTGPRAMARLREGGEAGYEAFAAGLLEQERD